MYIKNMTKSQLKAVLEEKQLSTSGTKSDLVTRLEATLRENGSNPDEFFIEKEEPRSNGDGSDMILKLLQEMKEQNQAQLAELKEKSQAQSAELIEMKGQTRNTAGRNKHRD